MQTSKMIPRRSSLVNVAVWPPVQAEIASLLIADRRAFVQPFAVLRSCSFAF